MWLVEFQKQSSTSVSKKMLCALLEWVQLRSLACYPMEANESWHSAEVKPYKKKA